MKFVVPQDVTSQFHLREGDKVADFGAGRGFFLVPLAEAVGSTGQVHLCEIQKDLVHVVGEAIRKHGYQQAQVAWCDLEEAGGIPIGDAALDAAIVVNTLFQIEDKQAALTEMVRTLRRGAKFFVIDWTDGGAGLGPSPARLVLPPDCIDLVEAAGCVFEREFPAGAHHYGLAFRVV